MYPTSPGGSYALGKRPTATPRRNDTYNYDKFLFPPQVQQVQWTPRLVPRHRRPRQRSYNKEVVAVIIILLVASIVSISTAYVLLISSAPVDSRRSSPGFSQSGKAHSVIAADSLSSDRPVVPGPSVKFLAYLPHSGFHNQRIALENALVLAHLLNRTLLLPSVRLGVPLAYAPFDELYDMAANATKTGLEHCASTLHDRSDPTLECENYASYTHIPWGWLIDLPAIQRMQPLLPGWNFTDGWLQDNLNLSAGDIFTLKDESRHQHAFQDFITRRPPQRKFSEPIHLAALAHRPERLVMLGSLFGSSRLHLRSRENALVRRQVREKMVFTNPHLANVTDDIRAALGGTYLAVHLRIGDGSFEVNAPEIVRRSWWKLLRLGLGFSDEEIALLEEESFPEEDPSEPPIFAPDLPVLRSPHPPLSPFPSNASPAPGFSCRGLPHSAPRLKRLNAPLYISTDAISPSLNPLLWRFLRTFPCSFFLEDFVEQTRPLGVLRSQMDGVPLGSFLMPFVDAMVAGQAYQVVGTESSTFSAFVTDVLWRRYHGFKIVQRG
ncbi:hypothetical protein LXA43DRAFT_938857 [Ganoderma leucocontextum]|nr:hypothetical protein LXA43DRAFT_938857 [Ganoderma leucocontextum]